MKVESLSCPWCRKKLKIVYPDSDGGCTLEHPLGCEILGGMVWLFRSPKEAAAAWNSFKVKGSLLGTSADVVIVDEFEALKGEDSNGA